MPEPDWIDDLTGTLEQAWLLLVRGAADRRAAFHTPTLASLGHHGEPKLRTLVLRAVSPSDRTLRFHTDRRSAKYTELQRDPRVSLHFYDPGAKIQIRLEGRVTLHDRDAIADTAWSSAQKMSRICYGVAPGPGTVIGEGGAFTLPEDADSIEAGRENFAVILVAVERLEWLYLWHRGHRRAVYEGTPMTGAWLTP